MISLSTGQYIPPAVRNFEVVERKGLGHPDTMSDLIADQFSYQYSQYCRQHFNQVLNHAVDKVTLVGASTKVRLGGFEVIRPAAVLLIGKMAPGVGSLRVPLQELLRNAVESVFEFCLPDTEILNFTNLSIHNTFSAPLDRPANFYLPDSQEEAQSIGRNELGANDTVFCTGSAGESPLEALVLELELSVTAPERRKRWPAIGTDVKVMAARSADELDLTMCIPVDPMAVSAESEYKALVREVEKELEGILARSSFSTWTLHVNTKDRDGGMYLAPFGTSFGKSDIGAVGRGNRREGFISAFRPGNIEAPCGKNPLHHAGRLYTIAAQRIADGIFADNATNSAVTIVARNGAPLEQPAYVHIDLEEGAQGGDRIRSIAKSVVKDIGVITNDLLTIDPVAGYRQMAANRVPGDGQ